MDTPYEDDPGTAVKDARSYAERLVAEAFDAWNRPVAAGERFQWEPFSEAVPNGIVELFGGVITPHEFAERLAEVISDRLTVAMAAAQGHDAETCECLDCGFHRSFNYDVFGTSFVTAPRRTDLGSWVTAGWAEV